MASALEHTVCKELGIIYFFYLAFGCAIALHCIALHCIGLNFGSRFWLSILALLIISLVTVGWNVEEVVCKERCVIQRFSLALGCCADNAFIFVIFSSNSALNVRRR